MGRPSDLANSLKFYAKIRERRGITNVIQEFKSKSRHDFRHWVYLKGGELVCSCECYTEQEMCWHLVEVQRQLEEDRRASNFRTAGNGRRAG